MFPIYLVCVLTLFSVPCVHSANYLIGAGIYDITGPAAEVNMMGYAMLGQLTNGIHLRLFSRAFVIADAQNKTRFAFVSLDACMGSQSIKLEVLKKLKGIYGSLYTAENVAISATHTHSGPGGYLQYVLFDVTSLGFVSESLNVIVDGIIESIRMAHDRLQPGNIFFNNGTLLEANINRSPSAYEFNPDKAHYEYNVDKQFVLLKMVDEQGHGIGMINWFAVHGTSMNNTNGLVSGDNKGYASFLMEQYMNGNGTIPGQGSFVAAFAQSNLGDVTPNTRGAFCANTGLPCDYNHSTCNGRNELCRGIGPGKDMFESTAIIARKQFEKALELYSSASVPVTGPVDFRQAYLDMRNYSFEVEGKMVHTCPSAMGKSFAAGTTDGPGAFNFIQNDTKDDPFWDIVRNLLHDPSEEQVKCHYPKSILLDTGEMHEPYDWQASIVDTQLLRVGQFVIAPVPGEFTTMSGRRFRLAINETLKAAGFPTNSQVVIAGLTNTYADYITTFEEYSVQRYEGGSTIYGPHTLNAYIDHYKKMANDLATGHPTPQTTAPKDLVDVQIPFPRPVLFDSHPFGKHFGDVNKDVNGSYKANETVVVQFWSGNPRNNYMTNSTFLTVEQLQTNGKWKVFRTDAFWDTKFHWAHTSALSGESLATISWDIDATVPAGSYRISHFGYHKPLFETPEPFNGTSSIFKFGNAKGITSLTYKNQRDR